MMFFGDSTLNYMCKTWATLLSGHKLRLHSQKFSKSQGHPCHHYEIPVGPASRIIVRCHCNTDATTPGGQKKHLMEAMGRTDGVPRVIVIGDSNAHSVCHGIHRSDQVVLDETKELISLARKLKYEPSVRLVWVGPVYNSKSYTLLAKRLYSEQVSLWRQAITQPNVHIVDQYALTEAVNAKQSADGLHYQELLDRNMHEGDDAFQISGPAIIYTLKLIINSLMNQGLINQDEGST